MRPAARREVAGHLRSAYDVGERRACRATGFHRSSQRYRARSDPQVELRMRPKELAAAYRNAATAVLEQCLPVCPTADFGAMLHESTLHLRLVNDARFPSRDLGPWMTIFAH